MDSLWNELFAGFQDWTQITRVAVRLASAAILGGIIGLERTRVGKAAGLRTHMLVALGAALFILVPVEAGIGIGDLSRVIQGVSTGIGFVGAGTILKLSAEREIHGLDTAATIWLTAAVGLAVGAGWLWPAILGVALAWIILAVLFRLEQVLENDKQP